MATLDETESQTMSSLEEITKNPKKTCQKLLKLLADEIEASPAKKTKNLDSIYELCLRLGKVIATYEDWENLRGIAGPTAHEYEVQRNEAVEGELLRVLIWCTHQMMKTKLREVTKEDPSD